MAKAENKTKPSEIDPKAFIAAIEPAKKQADAEVLLDFFSRVTGLKPKTWGPSIIGYGRYHYKYESGREGEHLMTGWSPRKSNLVFYIMPGYRAEEMQDKLGRLGKHKIGKACLYVNKIDDIDMDVLEEIVLDGIAYMREKYQTWDE